MAILPPLIMKFAMPVSLSSSLPQLAGEGEYESLREFHVFPSPHPSPRCGGRGSMNRCASFTLLALQQAQGHRLGDLDAVHCGRKYSARIARTFPGRV